MFKFLLILFIISCGFSLTPDEKNNIYKNIDYDDILFYDTSYYLYVRYNNISTISLNSGTKYNLLLSNTSTIKNNSQCNTSGFKICDIKNLKYDANYFTNKIRQSYTGLYFPPCKSAAYFYLKLLLCSSQDFMAQIGIIQLKTYNLKAVCSYLDIYLTGLVDTDDYFSVNIITNKNAKVTVLEWTYMFMAKNGNRCGNNVCC